MTRPRIVVVRSVVVDRRLVQGPTGVTRPVGAEVWQTVQAKYGPAAIPMSDAFPYAGWPRRGRLEITPAPPTAGDSQLILPRRSLAAVQERR